MIRHVSRFVVKIVATIQKPKMEVVKEMKIQSYAVLFGGFRVASKIPKVKLNADFPSVFYYVVFPVGS